MAAAASELELFAGCWTADPLFKPSLHVFRNIQRTTGTGVGCGQAPSHPFLSCLE